jgi:hypothetical protein
MAFSHVDRVGGHVTGLLRRAHVSALRGNMSCSGVGSQQGGAVICSYFDNRAMSTESVFAVRAPVRPIYRDIGATIPT